MGPRAWKKYLVRGGHQEIEQAPCHTATQSDILKTKHGRLVLSSLRGSHFWRWALVALGIVSVGLGIVGIVVPILPTTPFLLLAAACFLRSSERLHRWLLQNRVFGEYIRRYRSGEGLPRASKVTTLVLLWGTLLFSTFVVIPHRLWLVRLLLLGVGLGVTIHILRIKTAKPPR